MDSSKFVRLVREFPFLTQIVTQQNLSADLIGNIEVASGDRNLLEVKPSYQANDADQYGEYVEYRYFWCVAPGETVQLAGSHWRTIPYYRNDYRDADQIGAQLLSLDRDVQFIVEVSAGGWDWEDRIPNIMVYKMRGFSWRSFCRPTQVAHS